MLKKFDKLELVVRQMMASHLELTAENKLLRQKLDAKHEELMRAHQTIVELKDSYNHLRMANSMGSSDEEKKVAKDQLNKMVREIDKCLALLSQ